VLEKLKITDTETERLTRERKCSALGRMAVSCLRKSISFSGCLLEGLPISYNISSGLLHLYLQPERDSHSIIARIPMVLVFKNFNSDEKIMSITKWKPIKLEFSLSDDANRITLHWIPHDDQFDEFQTMIMYCYGKIIQHIFLKFTCLRNKNAYDYYFKSMDKGNSYQVDNVHSKFRGLNDSFAKNSSIETIYYPNLYISETKKNPNLQ
jgi:hypothetical protein